MITKIYKYIFAGLIGSAMLSACSSDEDLTVIYKTNGEIPGGDEPGGETAISTVSQSAANSVIYTISGQRVSKMGRGLFIVNGKKMISK